MKTIKYKFIVLILSVLCGTIALVNNNFIGKINNYVLDENNVTVNVKPKEKFTLYNALNTIYKYKTLEVLKVNLEDTKGCNIEVKYVGDFASLSTIMEEMCKIEEVIRIYNIELNNTESNATFDVEFILYK